MEHSDFFPASLRLVRILRLLKLFHILESLRRIVDSLTSRCVFECVIKVAGHMCESHDPVVLSQSWPSLSASQCPSRVPVVSHSCLSHVPVMSQSWPGQRREPQNPQEQRNRIADTSCSGVSTLCSGNVVALKLLCDARAAALTQAAFTRLDAGCMAV